MAKRRSVSRRRRRASSGSGWLYVVGGALALGLVAAVIMLGTASRNSGNGADDPIVQPPARNSAVPFAGLVYGNPSAAVTVTEYLDFQCPACVRAGLNVMSEIEDRYIESGQAKLEIKPIAILGNESVAATEAAYCAADQDSFFAYHDILFANQGAENDGGFNDNRLKEFAARVGLDTAAFDNCLDSGQYESSVKADTEAAKALGVSGTPTIFVNGQRVNTSIDEISGAIQAGLGGG